MPTAEALKDTSLATFGSFISKVYLWMTGGLAITAIVALFVNSNDSILAYLLTNPAALPILLIAELILVIGLSGFINKLSSGAAMIMFAVYAVMNGLFFGVVIYGYEQASVFGAFAASAVTFLLMALYGLYTKSDLTSIGRIAQMGLIGLLVGLVINLFVPSDGLSRLLTFVGIFIFVILIAYDTQKLKHIAAEAEMSPDANKFVILGALTLYLDFINLFIRLLQIMGKRK